MFIKCEFGCNNCELLLEVEKPCDNKTVPSICPHCSGVLYYIGESKNKLEYSSTDNIIFLKF